ncbi:hypothetical protein [Blastopirellula marina]|uniref:ATP-grasp domain-containing protein n=1 Tax=Blastopirellula marina TaxID=124 RepID=A0A2S8GUK5_9BACT|nr:hypothetical protein [Blastopirellula marina]PQO48107.1 hypothetical protein C5Y93_00040 [Blastopirellula marina]
MPERICLIGFDPPQNDWFRARIDGPLVGYESLPRIIVHDGQLLVESLSGFAMLPVAKVVFHGIFENDHDFVSGVALWGGPCLPNAVAMMDCRLKLPCLVRALRHSQFAAPPRGYASPGATYATDVPRVAKWGNWHCGENKQPFDDDWQSPESAIVEPFFPGSAVRVVVIGDRFWQIEMHGHDWLKSIHHPAAAIVEPDMRLVEDTQRVATGLGLEVAANDYMVSPDGVPHLLEVNHIPNVTRFPEIWEAYGQFVLEWLAKG